jgi:hypothetical protein
MVLNLCSVEPQSCAKPLMDHHEGKVEVEGRANYEFLSHLFVLDQSSSAFINYVYYDLGNVLFGKWVLL